MSQPGTNDALSDDPRTFTTWPQSRWMSLLASVLLHGAIYFLALVLLSGMEGSGDGSMTKGDGDAPEVGIFTTSPPGQSDSSEPGDMSDRIENAEPAAPGTLLSADEIIDAPPVPLLTPLPNTADSIIGPGPPTSVVPPSALSDVSKASRGVQGGRGTGGLGPGAGGAGTRGGGGAGPGMGTSGLGAGETQFFNIREKGLRFVYVVDRSVSMTSHNAIRRAKAELMSSLGALTADQQFQIVFYNVEPTVMRLGGGADKLYSASDVNRTLARQFISGITAELGTDHLPALMKGLQLRPDVLFFLTDAQQPELGKADREAIRKFNGGKTRIHCIEFGSGISLGSDRSFLEKLAVENGGRYSYRDITEFTR